MNKKTAVFRRFFIPTREKKVEFLFYILASFVAAVLDMVSLAMIARMIFSLFDAMGESKISMFLACVTEPFVLPVRFLLVKFNILQNSPIDWSFTISYLVIVLLRMFLPVL